MARKPKTEYQVVCARHGKEPHHRSHAYPKATLQKAKQAVIDNDHQSEMNAKKAENPTRYKYAAGEAPWRVETREVGQWEVVKE